MVNAHCILVNGNCNMMHPNSLAGSTAQVARSGATQEGGSGRSGPSIAATADQRSAVEVLGGLQVRFRPLNISVGWVLLAQLMALHTSAADEAVLLAARDQGW